MQANRTLNLIRNDKIWIAQSAIEPTDLQSRFWYVANYLLLRHDKSFIHLPTNEAFERSHLVWWPEYDIDLEKTAHA